MLYIFSYVVLKILGWRIEGSFRPGLRKCIILVGPHTSLWDFVYGRMIFAVLHKKVSFLIKSKFFFWPLGPIIRSLGAIPVEKASGLSQFHSIVNFVKNQEDIYLIITPEGTRKPVKRWKTGFYQLARDCELPMVLCWIDFKRKIGGIENEYLPSDNMDEDIKMLQRFYKAEWAKHPEKFHEFN